MSWHQWRLWPWNWVPYTREGRQTLIYLVVAGCGPALTFALWNFSSSALDVVRHWAGAPQLDRLNHYAAIAELTINLLGWALMVIVLALACFVSIRSLKLNVKDGTAEAAGDGSGGEPIRDGDQVTVNKEPGQ